ncbi:OmpA family protein [Falsiroseomonas oryzae]|uniref:OmpA family protein n=1 Tax=Falsiroseomonas oryzae TaxID=2766473 RepID=UPI0022EB6E7A|nr:OmpA family protein [Roseomonas sp. MO-31]
MQTLPARILTAFVVALACAGTPHAQEAATGTVTIEQPPPRPRGITIEQDGRPLTGTVPPGAAVDVSGANVVVVEETPRATRLTVRNDVLFDFDKAELRPEAAEALGRVAEIIRQRQPRAVRIVGHTDAIGSDAYNQALSERRARSVERWLAGQGGGLPPMQATGRGEAEPVASNTAPDGRDDPEGRQRNRRVEVLLER